MKGNKYKGLYRALANTEKKSRDDAFGRISKFLSKKNELLELDFLKLWKGLFYCFWMSDKIPIQQQLGKDIVKLMHSFDVNKEGRNMYGLDFFYYFLKTMHREWPGLDQHRLNKYLSLVRKFIAGSFLYLQKFNWSKEMMSRHNEIIRETLIAEDGIAGQVVDVYMVELLKLLRNANEEDEPEHSNNKSTDKTAEITQLLDPFFLTTQTSGKRVFVKRIHSNVFEFLQNEIKNQSSAHIFDPNAVAESLYVAASSKTIEVSSNRKLLYASYKAFKAEALKFSHSKKQEKQEIDFVPNTVSDHMDVEDQRSRKRKKKKKKNKPTKNMITKERKNGVSDKSESSNTPKNKRVRFSKKNRQTGVDTITHQMLSTPSPKLKSKKTVGILKHM